MLAGETLSHFSCESLHLLSPSSSTKAEVGSTDVSVRITNYRVIISSAVASWQPIDIPLASIKEVTKNTNHQYLDIQTKHVWAFRLQANDEQVLGVLYQQLDQALPRRATQLFCYTHHAASGSSGGGPGDRGSGAAVGINEGGVGLAEDPRWGIFNLDAELRRQAAIDDLAEPGLGSNLLPWFHIVKLPSEPYQTYPLSIVAPRRATLDLIGRVAKYRQNARVPAVSWIHLGTGGCIARCSQPLVGTHMRSSDDELMLSYLNQSLHASVFGGETPPATPAVTSPVPTSTPAVPPPSLFVDDDDRQDAGLASPTSPSPPGKELACEGRKLVIFDCRSKAAAAANLANGGGFELAQNYDRCRIHFLGLDNVHSVRHIFEKLTKTLHHEKSKSHHESSNGKIEQTGWTALVQSLLHSACHAADTVGSGDSVLVHCTDGWDRTSQVTTLAMILLDTHYRTVEGFCQLIEREWLQMGHRFADRCGHDLESDDFVLVADAVDEGEFSGAPIPKDHTKPVVSPVFIQWIDCVYQLLKMYPTEFEFTPHFLITLTDHVYSCRFGTFLFNCHRSRFRRGGVATSTGSVWSEIRRMVAVEQSNATDIAAGERILNPFFNYRRHKTSLSVSRRLVPNFLVRRYSFFSAWFNRYDHCLMRSSTYPHVEGAIGLEPEELHPLMDSLLSSHVAAQAFITESKDVAMAEAYWPAVVPINELMDDWIGPRSSEAADPFSNTAVSEAQFKQRADSKSCDLCATPFTLFNRRHTCRRCCCSCCSNCGSKFVVLAKGEVGLFEDRDATGPVRVCNACYAIWRRNTA